MGSGQLSAAESASSDPPSAELLLYLAEFGSDEGEVVDPIAVAKALERSTDSGQNAEPERTADSNSPKAVNEQNPEPEQASPTNTDTPNDNKHRP